MQLEEKILYLIAVGASVGADCQRCLKASIALALQAGATEREVEEARAVGKKIQRSAAGRESRTDGLHEESPSANKGSAACCGAGQIDMREASSK